MNWSLPDELETLTSAQLAVSTEGTTLLYLSYHADNRIILQALPFHPGLAAKPELASVAARIFKGRREGDLSRGLSLPAAAPSRTIPGLSSTPAPVYTPYPGGPPPPPPPPPPAPPPAPRAPSPSPGSPPLTAPFLSPPPAPPSPQPAVFTDGILPRHRAAKAHEPVWRGSAPPPNKSTSKGKATVRPPYVMTNKASARKKPSAPVPRKSKLSSAAASLPRTRPPPSDETPAKSFGSGTPRFPRPSPSSGPWAELLRGIGQAHAAARALEAHEQAEARRKTEEAETVEDDSSSLSEGTKTRAESVEREDSRFAEDNLEDEVAVGAAGGERDAHSLEPIGEMRPSPAVEHGLADDDSDVAMEVEALAPGSEAAGEGSHEADEEDMDLDASSDDGHQPSPVKQEEVTVSAGSKDEEMLAPAQVELDLPPSAATPVQRSSALSFWAPLAVRTDTPTHPQRPAEQVEAETGSFFAALDASLQPPKPAASSLALVADEEVPDIKPTRAELAPPSRPPTPPLHEEVKPSIVGLAQSPTALQHEQVAPSLPTLPTLPTLPPPCAPSAATTAPRSYFLDSDVIHPHCIRSWSINYVVGLDKEMGKDQIWDLLSPPHLPRPLAMLTGVVKDGRSKYAYTAYAAPDAAARALNGLSGTVYGRDASKLVVVPQDASRTAPEKWTWKSVDASSREQVEEQARNAPQPSRSPPPGPPPLPLPRQPTGFARQSRSPSISRPPPARRSLSPRRQRDRPADDLDVVPKRLLADTDSFHLNNLPPRVTAAEVLRYIDSPDLLGVAAKRQAPGDLQPGSAFLLASSKHTSASIVQRYITRKSFPGGDQGMWSRKDVDRRGDWRWGEMSLDFLKWRAFDHPGAAQELERRLLTMAPSAGVGDASPRAGPAPPSRPGDLRSRSRSPAPRRRSPFSSQAPPPARAALPSFLPARPRSPSLERSRDNIASAFNLRPTPDAFEPQRMASDRPRPQSRTPYDRPTPYDRHSPAPPAPARVPPPSAHQVPPHLVSASHPGPAAAHLPPLAPEEQLRLLLATLDPSIFAQLPPAQPQAQVPASTDEYDPNSRLDFGKRNPGW